MSLRSFYKSSPRLRRLWRSSKNQLTYWPARGAMALVAALPLSAALRLGEGVGALIYSLLPSLRRLSDEHLRLAFGDSLSPAERRRIARAAVMNAARSFCEIAKFDAIAPRIDDYVELDDRAGIDEVLGRGQGGIAVTGHIGNWEILAAYFGMKGFKVCAIARRMYEERLNAILVDFRARHGVETVLREDASSPRQILAALKNRYLLAMLVDQDTHAPSVSVPFFGRPARTPAAPATLALRRGTPLAPVFIERRAGGGYRITVHPILEIPRSGDRLEDVRRLATAYNQAIEQHIRRRPEEWVWWHERWRRPPIPHLDLDAKLQYSASLESRENALAAGE